MHETTRRPLKATKAWGRLARRRAADSRELALWRARGAEALRLLDVEQSNARRTADALRDDHEAAHDLVAELRASGLPDDGPLELALLGLRDELLEERREAGAARSVLLEALHGPVDPTKILLLDPLGKVARDAAEEIGNLRDLLRSKSRVADTLLRDKHAILDAFTAALPPTRSAIAFTGDLGLYVKCVLAAALAERDEAHAEELRAALRERDDARAAADAALLRDLEVERDQLVAELRARPRDELVALLDSARIVVDRTYVDGRNRPVHPDGLVAEITWIDVQACPVALLRVRGSRGLRSGAWIGFGDDAVAVPVAGLRRDLAVAAVEAELVAQGFVLRLGGAS